MKQKKKPKFKISKEFKDKYNITISKELDKYKGVVLFPEKLAKANEILKQTGLPKEFYEEQEKRKKAKKSKK